MGSQRKVKYNTLGEVVKTTPRPEVMQDGDKYYYQEWSIRFGKRGKAPRDGQPNALHYVENVKEISFAEFKYLYNFISTYVKDGSNNRHLPFQTKINHCNILLAHANLSASYHPSFATVYKKCYPVSNHNAGYFEVYAQSNAEIRDKARAYLGITGKVEELKTNNLMQLMDIPDEELTAELNRRQKAREIYAIQAQAIKDNAAEAKRKACAKIEAEEALALANLKP